MARFPLLSALICILASALHVSAAISNYTAICNEIKDRVSQQSDVTYPIQGVTFSDRIHHWFDSSTEIPACVAEVGSVEDVSLVLQIVGASRTPFAVYSGGHASNVGFSSTKGVHITLRRFNQTQLSEDKTTVTIGFGQTWVDVFEALADSGVNVVGGRVPGPGIGGFTLGGGYSCDTVKTFNVVLPNGTITTASREHNSDLFFALKGGMNRFGIVTSAEFYTHPQPPEVWGGLRIYHASQVPALLNATERFASENRDPRASVLTSVDGTTAVGPTALGLFFYDGPEKPEIFNLFDGLSTISDSTGRKPFLDLIRGFPAEIVYNSPGHFCHVLDDWDHRTLPGDIAALPDLLHNMGKIAALHGATTINYDAQPFLQYGRHATPSAFPHSDSLFPFNLYFAWRNSSEDEFWYGKIHQTLDTLKRVATEEGIYREDFPDYPNYALSGTSAEKLYGETNAGRLRQIRDQIDPDRIMDLAGGFAL
ncbi:hypothetical protein MYCTH_2126295 [Thermothelomyces thermophilus ATCC 42464]|uniref:FAD-binding PCMH-type domain-containing protein n=1 Tax=Thermothelomyces thermophilus (strain ATCC 42464 / BCRC 31852 / DSM 1799) TaxID=573729 RepID=G2QCC0_THET4|nr:uncharacterized protein MYCTH_2126295 [Thermothelomyces thermophilus ATCC 42464]AEO57295.1 hypothetical protein MYCTH_2126295 [Thermothelomyces thermophilus ATCC 42464]